MVGITPFYLLSDYVVILFLSFIGGFVDCAGYIHLYGLFTSSITGNLIVASTAWVEYDGGVFPRLFVTLLFALGAFAASWSAIYLRVIHKVGSSYRAICLLGAEIIVLVATLAVAEWVESMPEKFPSLASWQTILVGAIMAFAMGIQGAAGTELVKNCPSTTVMTANIVKTSTAAANALLEYSLAGCVCSSSKESNVDALAKAKATLVAFQEILGVVFLFMLGACAGVALTKQIRLVSLVVPIAMLLALLASTIEGEAQRTRKAAAEAAAAAVAKENDVELANMNVGSETEHANALQSTH